MKLRSRRQLLQALGLAAAGLGSPKGIAQTLWGGAPSPPSPAPRTMNALKLTPFVDPLPRPEILQPSGRRSDAALGAASAPYYAVSIKEVKSRLHRDLPETRLWSYGSSSAPILFEARGNQPILVDWINRLPPKHILPLGAPMKGMENAPPTRTVTHLHGGRVPSISDGYPEDWFGPGQRRRCYYPNGQDAAALWVHDHAMGVSRFNVLAGLAGWYILRDEEEDALGLPSGEYETPLLLYDRSFTPDGQLYYPNPPDEGAWSQEFLGDAMLVNGKVQPYFNVEPRKHRFRIGNVANSRFFSLELSNRQEFYVIGADQGLLAEPAPTRRLVLGPAERTDCVIDFSAARGSVVTLMSGALEILQFRVGQAKVEDPSRLPGALRRIDRIDEARALRTRWMTLDEFDGGNGLPTVMLLNRMHWSDPVTEIVQSQSTEIWSLANLTQDTHPIHLHLVGFQILDRRSVSVDDYLSGGAVRYTGPVMRPAAHEMAWKDVVQCPPGTVTRIIVPFTPYAGRYLWHCHILEHEANDMMRPYFITAPASSSPA